MIIAGGIGGGHVQGQEGRLRAVATVLEHRTSGKFALVACDVIFVTDEMVQAAATEVARRHWYSARPFAGECHAHSFGPQHGARTRLRARTRIHQKRRRRHRARCRTSQSSALDGCRFAYRLGEESTVGGNSRLLLADNTIYWIGPRDDVVRPTGPFDPQLPVLAFFGPQDRLCSLIYNHSTHTIGTVRPGVRSPSFYGLAAQEMEKELGATVTFFEGASGSTHNITPVPVPEAITRMKQAVTAALAKAEPRPVDRIVARKQPFTFRVRTFDEAVEDEKVVSYCRKRAPDHADVISAVFRQQRLELKGEQGRERHTWIHVLRIGDVAIVGVPAEYFTVLGLDIKRRSPLKDTLVVELADDWIGYLPDREGHQLGGYQTWMGHHSYAEPGTGERIADQAVALLREIAPERRRDTTFTAPSWPANASLLYKCDCLRGDFGGRYRAGGR